MIGSGQWGLALLLGSAKFRLHIVALPPCLFPSRCVVYRNMFTYISQGAIHFANLCFVATESDRRHVRHKDQRDSMSDLWSLNFCLLVMDKTMLLGTHV